jgi:hypothetical protein
VSPASERASLTDCSYLSQWGNDDQSNENLHCHYWLVARNCRIATGEDSRTRHASLTTHRTIGTRVGHHPRSQRDQQDSIASIAPSNAGVPWIKSIRVLNGGAWSWLIENRLSTCPQVSEAMRLTLWGTHTLLSVSIGFSAVKSKIYYLSSP